MGITTLPKNYWETIINSRETRSMERRMKTSLTRHEKTMFTTNTDLVDQAFRSPFFEGLEEIHGKYEIKEHKW